MLLHLSDLHFGNKNRFQGIDLAAFGQQFSRAVKDACNEQGWKQPVDLVVVSGDIAEVARPSEFMDGWTFLTAAITGLGLPLYRTLFVPGNHDVSWTQCKRVDLDREDGLINDAEYPKRLQSAKFEYYNRFLQSFYDLSDANLMQLPGRVLLDAESGSYLHDFTLEGMPISYAALNTSEKETHNVHGGELGKAQAEALIKAWMRPEYARYLKVAVVHHNPLASPIENLHWTEEWLKQQIAEKKLEVTPEWLAHYTADMAGFKGAAYLQRIVKDTGAHLVLHGHHHNPTSPVLWGHRGDGVAPVLSVGSFGLNANQIPTDQPLTCQIICFQIEPEPRLIAVPLEFDPNYRLPGTLEKGQFRLNLKSEAVYNRALPLPEGWIRESLPGSSQTADNPDNVIARKLLRFTDYYRNHLHALYSTYDLKNLGVLLTEMQKTASPKLDDLYLPLRFDANFDINKTDAGTVVDVDRLLNLLTVYYHPGPEGSQAFTPNRQTLRMNIPYRRHSLAITGAAGTGKTTWMRYTFRRMLQDERTLPMLLELRAVAKFWSERKQARNRWSIESYLEYWLEENAPAYKDLGIRVPKLLEAPVEWLPVLLVDGWDELGDMGITFREKLLGLMQQYPRLLVITSSRPYGSARPNSSDDFRLLHVQPLNQEEITAFALHFYQRCYQQEETLVRTQAEAFGKALARSEDAKLLAKTPLLLTMMLYINRSKRLPDKRHLLYEECLMSLLSERPAMQMEEGVRLLEGQWCPQDSGPARMQLVARMAYDLQTNHDKIQTVASTTRSIIVSKEMLKRYLPQEWEPRQKDGFLLWLCGRAGVMVDDAQDNIWFAHLSFQEFLTAWHLNYSQEDAEALHYFAELTKQPFWWETL
ncbi:MAG TPA: metallophosphoesterase, partial [Chthonomonadaceae bacterium]|nr:metallophosphoesterase [Chthonomonadaceae bacterium]